MRRWRAATSVAWPRARPPALGEAPQSGAVLSGSAASRAALARLNPCCAKHGRGMRFSPGGGRPLPGPGACGLISAHGSCHAKIRSSAARNGACRVGRYYPSGAGIGPIRRIEDLAPGRAAPLLESAAAIACHRKGASSFACKVSHSRALVWFGGASERRPRFFSGRASPPARQANRKMSRLGRSRAHGRGGRRAWFTAKPGAAAGAGGRGRRRCFRRLLRCYPRRLRDSRFPA